MEPQTQTASSPNKLSTIVLALLVVVALVLGYFLYQRMSGAGPVPGAGTGLEATSDERAVLKYPARDVTEEEWNNYLVLVAKLAVETDTITVGPQCSVTPVVLKTPLVIGKKVQVKNNDTVPHTISFNNPPTFEVPAKGVVQIPVDFAGIPGIYGYGCDNSPSAVGLIQVLQ